MSDSNDMLIKEVEEELRREQLEKLWKRYGNWFIAFSLGIVVAVAGYKGWQYYELRQARAAGEALAEAMDLLAGGKMDDARLKLETLAGGNHEGAAVLARLEQAGLALARGDRDTARRLYEELATDRRVDTPLRNAARVRLAWLEVDAASPEELKKRLAGLDVDGSPWQPAAREILALAYWRNGELKRMQDLLSANLVDPDTPPAARERARILLETIAPKLATNGNAERNTRGKAGTGQNQNGQEKAAQDRTGGTKAQ